MSEFDKHIGKIALVSSIKLFESGDNIKLKFFAEVGKIVESTEGSVTLVPTGTPAEKYRTKPLRSIPLVGVTNAIRAIHIVGSEKIYHADIDQLTNYYGKYGQVRLSGPALYHPPNKHRELEAKNLRTSIIEKSFK